MWTLNSFHRLKKKRVKERKQGQTTQDQKKRENSMEWSFQRQTYMRRHLIT